MSAIFTQNRNGFFDYLHYFAKKIEAAVVNDTIDVSPGTGTGFIKSNLLEDGFGLRYYNFTSNRDFECNMFTGDEGESVYKLIFAIALNAPNFSGVTQSETACLYCGDYNKKLVIRRGQHICRIVLIFNRCWIEKNHPEAGFRVAQLMGELNRKNLPAILPEEMDHRSFTLVNQLASRMNHLSFPPILVKMSGYLLLNNFLNRIMGQASREVSSESSSHFREIIGVEEKLAGFIYNPRAPLPKIEELAQEFNMSVSTLRRHFKVVFGKNIYEYYQEKRMLWAKDQLEKGHTNINEIARMLGFMKVNNFSKAFRKEFNTLPRHMKHLVSIILLFLTS